MKKKPNEFANEILAKIRAAVIAVQTAHDETAEQIARDSLAELPTDIMARSDWEPISRFASGKVAPFQISIQFYNFSTGERLYLLAEYMEGGLVIDDLCDSKMKAVFAANIEQRELFREFVNYLPQLHSI